MKMPIDYGAIGRRIKERRREKLRTQEWLAEYLQVSVGYISQIERGVTKTNLDTLDKIADCLGCELSELISGVSMKERGYLSPELDGTLERLNPRQRSMVMEIAELILNYEA